MTQFIPTYQQSRLLWSLSKFDVLWLEISFQIKTEISFFAFSSVLKCNQTFFRATEAPHSQLAGNSKVQLVRNQMASGSSAYLSSECIVVVVSNLSQHRADPGQNFLPATSPFSAPYEHTSSLILAWTLSLGITTHVEQLHGLAPLCGLLPQGDQRNPPGRQNFPTRFGKPFT